MTGESCVKPSLNTCEATDTDDELFSSGLHTHLLRLCVSLKRIRMFIDAGLQSEVQTEEMRHHSLQTSMSHLKAGIAVTH